MVQVDRNSLELTKDAINDFQMSLVRISGATANGTADMLGACQQVIKTVIQKVESSEKRIVVLQQKIQAFNDKIHALHCSIENLDKKIPATQQKIASLETEISVLEQQISQLNSQLAQAQDENIRRQIQARIDALSNQLSKTKRSCGEYKDCLCEYEKTRTEATRQLSQVKTSKADSEQELEKEKNKNNRLKTKLERLKNTYRHLESDVGAFIEAVGSFENTSSDRSQRSSASLGAMISAIDDYEGAVLRK